MEMQVFRTGCLMALPPLSESLSAVPLLCQPLLHRQADAIAPPGLTPTQSPFPEEER